MAAGLSPKKQNKAPLPTTLRFGRLVHEFVSQPVPYK
jgi:hypothetical protein